MGTKSNSSKNAAAEPEPNFGGNFGGNIMDDELSNVVSGGDKEEPKD